MSTAVRPDSRIDRERHQGKVALVTGAASGIGRGIALRLAGEGMLVACLDVNAGGIDETIGRIDEALGDDGRAISCAADVRDRAQIRAAIEATVGTFGKLDHLVSAAGLVTMTGFDDLDDAEWDRVIDVNLKGCFLVAQEAAKALSDGGSIVNISTIESDVVVSSTGNCQPHYNASKGGVRMLTKALAAELGGRGIRVNDVAPGVVDTPLTGLDLHAPEAWAFMEPRMLIKRLGQPDDIAAAVSFLLSDDASYITGVHLPVDGGWLVR